MKVHHFLIAVAAMAAIIAGSNYLVQFPVHATLGGINLADLLTYAAFTFPVAFLVTDLTNKLFGPCGCAQGGDCRLRDRRYRVVHRCLTAHRHCVGSAFLISQLLDVSIFDKLRTGTWWRAPLISSMLGAVVDTFVFFSFAFAASLSFLGEGLDFAVQPAPLLGVMATEAPRWVSWALGDLVVKVSMALVLLAPYGMLRGALERRLANPA
jgi:uncharacterized PurR-regulated membrane protein YhhQ (DUF165 family)